VMFVSHLHVGTRYLAGQHALFHPGVAKMPTGVNRSAVSESAYLRDKEARPWRQRK
jgi:hypothetical protein